MHRLIPGKLTHFTATVRSTGITTLVLLLAVLSFQAGAQIRPEVTEVKLEWSGIQQIYISEQESIRCLSFSEAVYPGDPVVPQWHTLYRLSGNNRMLEVTFRVLESAPLTAAEAAVVAGSAVIGTEYKTDVQEVIVRKEKSASVFILPLRKLGDGTYEKLVRFSMEYKEVPSAPGTSAMRITKGNSLLSTGVWYKVKVSKPGVYRLDYSMLNAIGLTGSGADKIQLYGMGGASLPEKAGDPRPDGLQEIPVMVYDGGDGSIDPGDYLAFYGEGPGRWKLEGSQTRFVFQRHLYDQNNYYFITRGNSAGLRIQPQVPPTGTPTHSVTTFHDFQLYENDSLNLIKSGKLWLGEEFDLKTQYQFSFSFPNIDPMVQAEVLTSLAARSLTTSSFTIQSGSHSTSASIFSISTAYNTQYANTALKGLTFNPSGNTIPVTLTYNKPLSSSVGWLDYILVNLRRKLIFPGGQMHFRDPQVTGTGNIASYTIDQASSQVVVWDITSPMAPELIQSSLLGSSLSFKADASQLREYVAFQGSSFLTPEVTGKVANQNLRGMKPVEMVIICHPDFLSAANRLATIHLEHSGLTSLVVTPGMVYNEFSSGKQDPTAIRDFMKMLYDGATTHGEMPKYLLLFGDGSHDNMNRVSSNTNFIPTFQSEESLHPAYTFVTDDYYGLLDDGEGPNGAGHLDLGIGRIPVATPVEATQMVDKTERYLSINTDIAASSACAATGATKPLADWRNSICLVADDEDSNLHVDQAEMLANYLDAHYGVYNINKIYIDAYHQESISGGHRYPDVNDAINRQVSKGALVVNYIGHGGEVSWAHERILRIDDILTWNNSYSMPLFLTSTCEFSRFDDPARRSAGEYAYLNPSGGAVAMFTTTRLAFASSNYAFNTAFYQNVFKKESGEHRRLGDVFMWSKIESGSVSSNRNMVVLGDPAIRLGYPTYKVLTTHINDSLITASTDTLKALSKITIQGMIADQNDQLLQGFNGVLYPVVYDKKITFTTLANDALSYPKPFWMQKNILYKGKVSIRNGIFSFTFIVPKDIQYAYGFGKISYYAENGAEDASGWYDKIVVGGTSQESITDNEGPVIRLYMNDSTFVFGGTTDANPILFARLYDEHGINTTGGSIGHDIVSVLDGNTNNAISLNDYFESDLDSYNSGSVVYALSDLTDGPHTLTLKVWDIFNNSSEAYTEFIVASANKPVLTHVLNYPNPFTTHTEFWFEHNQACCDIDVTIEVFSVSGRLVKTIRETVATTGYRIEPIPWDGMDDHGDRLARGVYVYKVTIRNKDLESAEKFEKLVILR